MKRAERLSTIVVATTDQSSDDPVAVLAKNAGVAVFRGDERDVLDRVYRAAQEARADIVVRLTGDCPLADPAVIDEVVTHFTASALDYTITPHNYPEGLDTEVFTFAALERAHQEAKLPSERARARQR